MLLRFEGSSVAYGDCFPWPALGDLPLEAHLEALKKGRFTPLVERSFFLAQGSCPAPSQNLHESPWNRPLPKNHALIADVKQLNTQCIEELAALGFDRMKIKLNGTHLEDWASFFLLKEAFRASAVKLRIDFNNSLKPSQFETFLRDWGSNLDLIDFVEDPFPYHAGAWRELTLKFGVRLALDSFCGTEAIRDLGGCQVVVYKPASPAGDLLLKAALEGEQALVVTSYLDHVLGQWHAARVCGALYQQFGSRMECAGLLSQRAYENPHLLDCLPAHGPWFQMSLGGFQVLRQRLEQLDWEECSPC